MQSLGRLVVVGLLLGGLFGLCLHYGAVEDDHSPYPIPADLYADYDGYVGEDALVFGDVLSVDDDADRAKINVDSSAGSFEMVVTGFTERVQPAGVVQVYGVLEPDRTIDAGNVAVVNPAGGSKTYKYTASAVGAVLVLVVFFREWRIDRDSFAFEVGSDG